MLLAQISDLHFRSEGRKLYEFIDINGENAKVINQLNALSERPDAVVISGDIVNCGSPQEYQMAQRVLQMLDYPLYVIPGNHDDKPHFLNAMRPLCPQLGDDPENIRYAVDDFPMRLLFIDTSLAGQAKGWLTPSTLGWLEQQLQDHSTRETAIFMHHRAPAGIGAHGSDRLRERKRAAGANRTFSAAYAHFLRPYAPPDYDAASAGDYRYGTGHRPSGAVFLL